MYNSGLCIQCIHAVMIENEQYTDISYLFYKGPNTYRFRLEHNIFSLNMVFCSQNYIHLDSTLALKSWSTLPFLQLFISISYVTNINPFTGKALMQINENPRKKLFAPPSLYVFIAQSHAPLYSGCVRLSVMILDFITSIGNTKTQLITPNYKQIN